MYNFSSKFLLNKKKIFQFKLFIVSFDIKKTGSKLEIKRRATSSFDWQCYMAKLINF